MMTNLIIAIAIGIGYIALFFAAYNELMKPFEDNETRMYVSLDRIIITDIDNGELERLAKTSTNGTLSIISLADDVEGEKQKSRCFTASNSPASNRHSANATAPTLRL